MNLNALNLLIVALAVWRLASLLANEDGPFAVFYRFRHYTRRLTVRNRFWRAFKLHQGVTCEWCNSIWIATGLALLLGWHPLTIFALSALAIVIKYTVHTLEQLCSYVEKLNKLITPQKPPDKYSPVIVPLGDPTTERHKTLAAYMQAEK